MHAALGILLVGGLAAGWSLATVVPPGLVEQCSQDVVTQPFRLQDEVTVTEERCFFLPQLWGDFEMLFDVELSAGAEVDVLLRQVEPRFVDEVQDPFTGRFSVLRISASQRGVGWRTRDEALFGPVGGGVGVEPGRPATVWIEAHGTTLTANVGGKRQASFEAADVYGMLTMVVRGGQAVVRNLSIDAHPVRALWRWRTWTWVLAGGLAGLVVAGAAALLSARRQLWAAGAVLFVAPWSLTRSVEMSLMFPSAAALAAVLVGASILAGVVAVLRGRAMVAATAVVGAAAACCWIWPEPITARLERGLGVPDASRVDVVFGPDAGEQPSKALSGLVRMPNGLLDQSKRGKRVFLLGGAWLYNRSEPGLHLGLQLGTLLRGAFGRGADAPSLPTVDGSPAQQWRLFDGFYQDFAPDLLVFGVGSSESADEVGGPRTTPASLQETLRAVRADCRERRRGLVLFLDVGAPAALRDVVRSFASDEELSVVELFEELPRLDVARRLFDASAPLLR